MIFHAPPASFCQVEVNVPICVGERLYTRHDFLPLLEQHLTDYIMPDVVWTGGISELLRIATLAEAYHVPISPHNAMGPLQVLAGAHLVADRARLAPQQADQERPGAQAEEALEPDPGTLVRDQHHDDPDHRDDPVDVDARGRRECRVVGDRPRCLAELGAL